MKIYGYKNELVSLSEITIQASYEELKKLSDFILDCASAIKNEADWEHAHYKDFIGHTSEDEPDLIIFTSD